MRDAMVKIPSNPRSRDDWKAGFWPGSTRAKVKYQYKRGESLDSIAKKLSGKSSGDAVYPLYAAKMTWKDVTRLNYGTEHPPEVNYYLKTFNRCTSRTADGNYLLGASDAEPWLWIPAGGNKYDVKLTEEGPAKICLPPPQSQFTRSLLEIFSAVDADNDGFISKTELWKAVANPGISGTSAMAVVTAKDFYSQLEDIHTGYGIRGISRADLIDLDARGAKNPEDELFWKPNVRMGGYRETLCAAEHELFVGAPNATVVKQGSRGDCWLLAALVGLAHREPDAIKRMVTPDPESNGQRFKVKFPGESELVVDRPTDGEMLLMSSAPGNGLWLAVIEKAWGEIAFHSVFGWFDSSPNDPAVDARFLSRGIELVTGGAADMDWLGATALKTTREKLDKAFAANKVVTAGIGRRFMPEPGWPPAHAYTVMGYDRKTDQILVRNPWGYTGPGNKLKEPVSIPLSEFDSLFTMIAYEE
jgi:hypothetical protein